MSNITVSIPTSTVSDADIIGLVDAYVGTIVVADKATKAKAATATSPAIEPVAIGDIVSFDEQARVDLQMAFRSVHVTKRAPSMSAVTMHLITKAYAPAIMADVTKAITDLPQVVTRVTKAVISDDDAAVVRSAIAAILATITDDDIRTALGEDATIDLDSDIVRVYRDKVVSAATKAVEKVTTGAQGDVTTFDDTLGAMIDDGVLEDGCTIKATHKGRTISATVTRDTSDDAGKQGVAIVCEGNTYRALSTVLTDQLDCGNNGWQTFTLNGTQLRKLRRS